MGELDIGRTLLLWFWAFCLAGIEIEVEGGYGWAERLPTWYLSRGRVGRIYGAFMGHRPLTGYHVFAFAIPLLVLHLPFVFGVHWTLAGELATIGIYFALAVVWDYLWFVLNPAYTVRRFEKGRVWWFQVPWIWRFPLDYYVGIAVSIAFAGLAAVAAGDGAPLWRQLWMLAGLAVLTAIAVALAPLYHRWYRHMRRADDRRSTPTYPPPAPDAAWAGGVPELPPLEPTEPRPRGRRPLADGARLRVLYGVNGEGMGHATRSQVVIDSLLARGHDVRVVASGSAFAYLRERLPRVDEIFGPTFALDEGEIRRWATVRQNVRTARQELPETIRRWAAEVEEWRPDVVISDFEPLSGVFARLKRTPLIAVGNINLLDRCRHDKEILAHEREDFVLARAISRNMVPGAVEYIVTTYFQPPIARGGTTFVPPIIRPEILDAASVPGDHLVVYWSGDETVLEALRAAGQRCLVYGMQDADSEPTIDGNLEFRPRSTEGFVEALRTSRGVVAGGGFSLLSEAVYLGKPILSIPLRGQFEQVINARYTQRLGYGMCAPEVTPERMREFVSRLPEFEEALAGYEQDGNTVALRTIEDRALAAARAPNPELRRDRWTARRAAR